MAAGMQTVGAIALTAVLGLLVSLSTFLTIGATSSVTYNGKRSPCHVCIGTSVATKSLEQEAARVLLYAHYQ